MRKAVSDSDTAFSLGNLRAEYRQFPGSLAVRIFCIMRVGKKEVRYGSAICDRRIHGL